MAIDKSEWRRDLTVRLKDGGGISVPGGDHSLPEVIVGLTDSERWLAFIVTTGEEHANFVLHMEQVEALHTFLGYALPHMKPIGPRRR